jgi:hypothetical protein
MTHIIECDRRQELASYIIVGFETKQEKVIISCLLDVLSPELMQQIKQGGH